MPQVLLELRNFSAAHWFRYSAMGTLIQYTDQGEAVMKMPIASSLAAALLLAVAAGCSPADESVDRREETPDRTTSSTTLVVERVASIPDSEGPNEVQRDFTDSRGRKPVDLRIRPGHSVVATFVDSASSAAPIPEQRSEALRIARELWNAMGKTEKADTVAVTITNHPTKAPGKRTAKFYFYPPELNVAR